MWQRQSHYGPACALYSCFQHVWCTFITGSDRGVWDSSEKKFHARSPWPLPLHRRFNFYPELGSVISLVFGGYEAACITSVVFVILLIFASGELTMWWINCIPTDCLRCMYISTIDYIWNELVSTVHSTYKHAGYKHSPFISMVFVQSRLKSMKCNGNKLRL